MSLTDLIDSGQRFYRKMRVSSILACPYYVDLSVDERQMLKLRLYGGCYTRFMEEQKEISLLSFPESVDLDAIKRYNLSGYCANTLSGSTLLALRRAMYLYRCTGDGKYFVRHFHKDMLTSKLEKDIIHYYRDRRDLTLVDASKELSEKYGMRIPSYQISRIARRKIDSSKWRKRLRVTSSHTS